MILEHRFVAPIPGDAKNRRRYNGGMRRTLIPHPDSPAGAVTRIEVMILRPRPETLALHFFLSGRTSDLRMPPPTTPERGHRLWEHSCFEAFVRASPEVGYYEFNFAPSMHWAAYRFTGYRTGMRPVTEMGAPRLEVHADDKSFQLSASLDFNRMTDLPRDSSWHIGVSAVIEGISGRKSYWALAHPPGKPDFHHSVCFACDLPAAAPP